MTTEMKKKLLLVAASVIGYALLYNAEAFFAHHLGMEDYGDVSVAVHVSRLIAVLALLGFSGSVIKFIPPFFEQKSMSEVKGLILTGTFFIAGFGLFISLITIVLFEYLGSKFGFKDHPILLSVPLIIPVAFFFYAQNISTAQHQTFKSAIIGEAGYPLLLFLFAGGFLYFLGTTQGNDAKILSESMAIDAYLAARITAILFFAIFIIRFWRKEYGKEKPKIAIKHWVSKSSSFFLAALPLVGIITSSSLMMENLQPNEDEVGIFSAALVVAMFPTVILDGVRLFTLSHLSIAISKNNIQRIISTLQPGLRIIFITNVVIVAVLTTVGDKIPILHVDGDDPKLVVAILGLAFFMNTMSGLAMNTMQYSGAMRRAILTNVFVLVLNILLGFILIPKFNSEGAATSLLVAYAIPQSINFYWISKHLGIPYLQCIFSNPSLKGS